MSNSFAVPTPIDLKFRPASYFWPLGLEKHLLARVKGAQRRQALSALIDQGRLDEIPEFLYKSALDDEERTVIGRLHPMFMGGEYLPDMGAGEVEIARIAIRSTTGDVTSLYARRSGRRIVYRMVDEYGGDTLRGRTWRTSTRPLAFGTMAGFFLGAWDLLNVLDCNYDNDLEGMLRFFRGTSAFYPDFDRYLRERVREQFQATHDAPDNEKSDSLGISTDAENSAQKPSKGEPQ